MTATAQPVPQPPPPRSSFPSSAVLAACREYGPELNLPAASNLVGWLVMAAIASNESSLGADCGPRHEPAYEAGGAVWARKAMAPLLSLYPPVGEPPQSPAACSYGPWQMMFLNCPGASPEILLSDLEACAGFFVKQFNSYVEGAQHAVTLEEIGEVWNMGHIAPDPAYTTKLAAAYQHLAGNG